MPVIVAGFLVVDAPIDKLVWFFNVVHTYIVSGCTCFMLKLLDYGNPHRNGNVFCKYADDAIIGSI